MAGGLMMSGMSGASMLRTRRRDVNVKPNRRLDRKSSRGMLYENEELRLRTININAEVERGQSDIKKLRRENEQLKREIGALRYEYERLDRLLRERRLSVSPEHSDQDSASVCSACPDCAVIEASPARAQVSFQDLTVVPEEDAEGIKSSIESRCSCEECSAHVGADNQKTRIENNAQNNHENRTIPTKKDGGSKPVDVLLHDAPPAPKFFQTLTSPAYQSPPPPGFNISPYQTPTPIGRFKNGGNVEDLLGDMQATPLHTTFIQQNSVFMCNTKKVMQKPCQCCLKSEPVTEQKPKHYVTEKNIELNYDYPRATPLTTPTPNPDTGTTTTEVASTVVFVERRIPVRPRKFDFFFRSRSAPVGENEEPIYATVNKLPKRLKRMELANLEKEVAYKANDCQTEPKTDSEQSQAPVADDDTSHSEVEKVVQRQDTPKAKKRKRFSLTFKKRERKRREIKKDLHKNGAAKNGVVAVEENHRLLSHETIDLKSSLATEVHKHCTRHRPRNTLSSSSSGPRYRRDSCYQEMTTSHSEHERTNSMCSSMNSLASACTHKSRKLSAAPTGDAIPWCGCWGAGCV